MKANVVGFNYAVLKGEAASWMREQTRDIRGLLSDATRSIVEIGKRLEVIKRRIGPARFREWCGAEFRWRLDVAYQYIRVAKVFADADGLDSFEPGALYALVKKNVPDEAKAEAMHEAQAGKTVTRRRAFEIISKHRRPYERNPIAVQALWRLRSSLKDAEARLDRMTLQSLTFAEIDPLLVQLEALIARLRQARAVYVKAAAMNGEEDVAAELARA